MKICPQCLKQYDDDSLEQCPADDTRLRKFNDQATRLIGKVLDERWVVDEKIGEGGMGEVFRGRQLSVDRPVAIKVLRPAMAVSEEYVNRFFREANLASQINHPNFVTIYDFGQAADLQILYLAMEYLEGWDLGERMLEEPMGLDHVLEISIQICAALTAAHEANIVHRDLKPENIFLMNDVPGQVNLKVLDFGIAKEIGSSSSMTKTGQIFGTPEYMSPEQCQSRTEVDGRSDLYSLGCILYELISGRSPFHRDTIIQTLLAQVTEEPKDIRSFQFVLPEQIASIVMRLLNKDPSKRYASAELVSAACSEELERLRLSPLEMAEYMDSGRLTAEFDRRVHSSAETAAFDPRQPSQLINLHSYQHLQNLAAVEPVKEAKRRSKGPLVALVLGLLVAGGVYAGSRVLTLPPVEVDVTGAIQVAEDAMSRGQASGMREATSSYSRRLAGNTTILATSLAMARPTEAPKKKRQIRKKKRHAPLLGIRTKKSVEKNAKKYSRKLIRCYSRRENPEAQGDVSFSFRIQGDGSVKAVKITGSTLGSDTVTKCIKQQVGTWRFAADPNGGAMSHARSITFKVN